MSAKTLAAAFAAASARTLQPLRPTVAPGATPGRHPEVARVPTVDETILMTILRQSLSPSDQIMARKAMLGRAPWETQ